MQVKKTKKIHPQLLIQHLMEVEVYKFHGFIWALVNSNQCHLAELLGCAVCDYLDLEVYLMSSSFCCPACHEFYTKANILTGCGHYVCKPCVKGAQFMCKDDKKEGVTCPVPECGKITEASPSDGNIGLEEDGDFGDFCCTMLKEVTKVSGETISISATESKEEEISTNGSEAEEEEMLTNEGKEEVGHFQHLEGEISDLETNICCLQKYRDVLEEHKPDIKDYIRRAVKKVKQKFDEQGKETLAHYSSLHQKVEMNLQKFVKWQDAASELSVIMKARPELLERCMKRKVTLPKETMTDAEEQLIAQLDAGCSIPSLLTRFPYITKPPVKAKFFMKYPLEDLEHHTLCYKLAWMPDGTLLVLTNHGVWRLDLNIDTAECTPTEILTFSKPLDMSVAADGTWILSRMTLPCIKIHYPGLKMPKLWRPEGVKKPCHLFINNNNIFVSEFDTPIIRSYNRELVYVDQYDIGTDDSGDMLVTETGKLVKSSDISNKIFIIDLETKETSSFDSEGGGDEDLNPTGCCSLSNEYFLVSDWNEELVSVFTHDGQFVHHLDVEGDIEMPHKIAVLARSGKPTLMALGGVGYDDDDVYDNDVVYVYSLE